MNEIIEKLKKLANNIQAARLGKRDDGVHINSHQLIDEYHEWRTRAEDLFESYFDESNAQYKAFKEYSRDGNGYELMHSFKAQFPIFNLLVDKIESGTKSIKPDKNEDTMKTNKRYDKEIFISHSSKDKQIATDFLDLILLGALSININQVFCTSADGTKIKSGDDWRDSIKDNLLNVKVNFLIITPNYKESEICLNEMGAAWISGARVIPLIVEPIDYDSVGVIQEPKQVEKLLDEGSLDKIRDILQEELNLEPSLIKSDRWTSKKKEFISKTKEHINKHPFKVPMDRKKFDGLLKENKDLNKTIDILRKEKTNLEELINDLETVKDKKEVNKVKRDKKLKTDYDKFLDITKRIKTALQIFSPIVRGLIFKEFTRKTIDIRWEYYKDDLYEAIANDYITDELTVDWETTSDMRNIDLLLRELNIFLNKEFSASFMESYESDFDAPLKTDNKNFWEEVFELKVEI